MIKRTIKRVKHHQNLQTLAVVIVIAVIASIGVYLVSSSHAATPYVTNYATNGTRSGTTSLVSGGSSSSGQAVQLGTVPTTGGGSGINPAPTGPATPAGGWHIDLADDFNAPLGMGSGQDPLWYPNVPWSSPPTTNAIGINPAEAEYYNSSQVSVSGGNLVLTDKYDPGVGNNGDGDPASYLSGIVTSPTNQGVTGFNWTPGNGSTWAFEIDCQWPLDSNDDWMGFWSTSTGNWAYERDFIEGDAGQGNFDTDWIYNTSGPYQDWFGDTITAFNPSAAMHRYTYVIYPDQSWSLYIDGQLQTWVGNNGISPAETGDTGTQQLLIQWAMHYGGTIDTAQRQFLINSVAVYQDGDHAGQGVTGGGTAPGTTIN